MKHHCCDNMRIRAADTCEEHKDKFECPDCLVHYSLKFDEYGIIIHDGGSSYVLLAYCPWCGARLPDSKRDRWFKELELLGVDEPFSQEIPERYQSDEWYADENGEEVPPATDTQTNCRVIEPW